MYGVVRSRLFAIENFQCLIKMGEDQWMHDSIMSEEVDMNEQKEETKLVFATRDDVLNWTRVVAYEIGFVEVIMRSNTNTGMRGRTLFVLIGYERSDKYKVRKKDLVRTNIDSRKCRCPFKLCEKSVVGGQ
ncbi:hypothetical protein HKD37_08G022514 [Glycine soja]